MKKITLLILTALLPLLGYSSLSDSESNETTSTFIAPAPNDQCAWALNIPVNSTDQCIQVQNASFSGSTVSSEGGTSCGANNSGDIWFKFTAIGTAQIIDLLNFKGTTHPISLTLYQGECGSLNQLYCSFNNSITATNLTIGATYLIRASINAVTTDRNVQFDICVKTPKAPANGTSANCLINTVNSDFEIPTIANNSLSFQNDNTMLGWRTTATDHIIEMWNNYQGVQAYSGTQFIELNAYQASGVYQDYSTPVTTVFNYGFAHRGRQGTDVCGLYAGPPGGPYTLIKSFSAGKTAWIYNEGSFTITPTPGQPVTRLIFQAISSSSGNATIGNFLDSITFTANNGIVTPSPVNLGCMVNSTNVEAVGQGTWTAHNDNPSSTVIGDPSLNATTISGFTVSGTYKYDWTTLYCTSTLEINYHNKEDNAPSFTQIMPICWGETLSQLPPTSIEGISGTWSPALNNKSTTTYTFTPDTNTCAKQATMTITVNPILTPNFTQLGPICSGESFSLPTTSNEGITGTWTPPINNTETTTYTFAPSTGVCTTNATMTVSINEKAITDFHYPNLVYCKNESYNPLPVIEDLAGTFSASPAGLSINSSTGEINLAQSNPGTYIVTNTIVAINACATSTSTTTVTIVSPAEFDIKEGCSGNDYRLVANPINGSFSSETTIEWTALDGGEFIETDKKNTIILKGIGTYRIKVTTEGCTSEKTVTVTNASCSIQKGISPGSGTRNSTFDLSTLNVKRLEIFNRYGTEVYSLNNYTNQWYGQTNSGEELPDGTYFYQIHNVDNKVTTGWIYVNRKL